MFKRALKKVTTPKSVSFWEGLKRNLEVCGNNPPPDGWDRGLLEDALDPRSPQERFEEALQEWEQSRDENVQRRLDIYKAKVRLVEGLPDSDEEADEEGAKHPVKKSQNLKKPPPRQLPSKKAPVQGVSKRKMHPPESSQARKKQKTSARNPPGKGLRPPGRSSFRGDDYSDDEDASGGSGGEEERDSGEGGGDEEEEHDEVSEEEEEDEEEYDAGPRGPRAGGRRNTGAFVVDGVSVDPDMAYGADTPQARVRADQAEAMERAVSSALKKQMAPLWQSMKEHMDGMGQSMKEHMDVAHKKRREMSKQNPLPSNPTKVEETTAASAARVLKDADVLLLVTGAGFSADSGLAVYQDVGKVEAYQLRCLDYADICQRKWIDEEPALFYGFWGQCFNDYRSTKPHDGYEILRRRRDDKNNNNNNITTSNDTTTADEIRSRIQKKYRLRRPFDDDETQKLTPYHVDHTDASHVPGAFFSFTSNVDAHQYDVFGAHEIHECHGNIELWQCSDRDCDSGIWRAPVDTHYKFVVDLQTMLAPPEIAVTVTATGPDKVGEDHRPISDDDDDDTPARVGHVKSTGRKRLNLLQHMPPGLDEEGWSLNVSGGDDHYGGGGGGGDDDEDSDNNSNNSKEDTENSISVVGNWPRCGYCKALSRPSILMFADQGWKYDMSQYKRWQLWKEAVLDLSRHRSLEDKASVTVTADGDGSGDGDTATGLKVCILEIGCGLNVPTCRWTTEDMVEEVLAKGGHPTLIRINPDIPNARPHSISENYIISIKSKGLEAIRRIDKIYQSMNESLH